MHPATRIIEATTTSELSLEIPRFTTGALIITYINGLQNPSLIIEAPILGFRV